MLSRTLALAGGLAAALSMPSAAWACASCSAGGDDPLVLYPNETWKLYLSAGRQAQFTFLKADGTAGVGINPDTRDAFTLAVGHAITRRVFATVALPLVRNAVGSDAAWGLGDLSLASRWTVVPQDFVDPYIPQVQLLGGYRNAIGRSGFDSVAGDGLDEFGQGVDEGRLGVDVWFGMFAWKLGAAGELLLPFGRFNSERAWLRNAPIVRALVSTGYGWEGWGRAMISLVRDQQGEVSLAGQKLPNTGKTVYSLSVSVDAEITEQDVLRVSAARLAAFSSNNVTQATSVGLAYLHAW